MKKYLLLVILLLLIMPFMVKAEECDTDKISIESIAIEDKTDNVIELTEAKANDKTINLDLNMSSVGDNVQYKIVVRNESNDDYELDKNSLNIGSDYIDYSFSSNDNSNIVKANSSKTFFLRVKYNNEVPSDAFVDGIYNDNITMKVNLSSEDTLINPNTGMKLILLLVLIVIVGVTAVLNRKKIIKAMILIIGVSIIIPLSVNALCNCEISIESNIKIGNISLNKIYIADFNRENMEEYSFEDGMTWAEWINSSYNKDNITFIEGYDICYINSPYMYKSRYQFDGKDTLALMSDLLENEHVYYHGIGGQCER